MREAMEGIGAEYLARAGTWLILTTLVYFLMNGAQIFETAAIVPKFTAAPPESLALFRGEHGLDFKIFWIVFHSVHELTFLLAIWFCWKLDIRNWLLILFAVHMAVRVWTLAYFAPAIMEFQAIANAGGGGGTDLLTKAAQWRSLNYVRVGVFLAVSVGLLPLCRKVLKMQAAF